MHAHERITRDALSAVESTIRRYTWYPDRESYTVAALWTLHAHIYKHFDASPRLFIHSVEYGSGKTLAQNLIGEMCPNYQELSLPRPQDIYGPLEEFNAVTFSIDETDNLWGKGGNGTRHPRLLTVLNKGFDVRGTVTHGTGASRRMTPIYAPFLLSGVGVLPRNIGSRCIGLRIQPLPDTVEIDDFTVSDTVPELHTIRDRLTKWAETVGPHFAFIDPDLPDSIRKRSKDKWLPLFAIADMAGGPWPRRIKRAARVTESGQDAPLPVQLARDVYEVAEAVDGPAVFTSELSKALTADPYHWDPRYVHGKSLAKVLGDYGLSPRTVRRDRDTGKGYRTADVTDRLADV